MSENIFITRNLQSIDDRDFEVVERKGVGHPDTLADGLAETISNEYSKYCLNKFGAVLHHNLDKVAVIGGLVNIGFGYGKMLKRAKIILNGRMSDSFGKQKINIQQFQNKVTKQYLGKVLPNVNLEKWIEMVNLTNPYSHNPYWYHPRNLNDLPDHFNPHANDTSTCVGYWPLSIVERLVLSLEKYFYTKKDSPKYDFIGQDIKITAVRKKKNICATACVPFISTKTEDRVFYDRYLKKFRQDLEKIAKKQLPKDYKFELFLNTADTKEDCYLLLTGSCIEAGEEGVVGRGNRSRGTISTTRPYSMEAANGKNPVYHVGKVFTVLADSLSRNIAESFNCECNVILTTRNKDNLYQPHSIIIETNKSVSREKIKTLNAILEKHFTFSGWTDAIINKELLVPKPGRGNFFKI